MPEAVIAFEVPLADRAPRPSVLPAEMRDVVWEAGGQRLIDGLTLRLERRGLTVMMGPNGAGKSLTLRLLQGLLRPAAGAITYGGRSLDGRAAPRVALMFQRPVLLRRSAAANLKHALAVYGVPAPSRPGRLADLLALGGLDDLAVRPARLLSGGEQQRLALVRALAAEPELLLLDEPASSLDPRSTQAIEALIGQVRAAGTKVVLVTHDVGQAKRLADDVVFLHRGRVIEQGPAHAFFARPETAAARAYLAGDLVL